MRWLLVSFLIFSRSQAQGFRMVTSGMKPRVPGTNSAQNTYKARLLCGEDEKWPF